LTTVALVVGFVSTPYLLEWLGTERFGAFRAANDWFAYLSLLELGVGGSLLALLAKAVGEGNERSIRNVLATGMWWYIRIAITMIAVGLVLSVVITRLIPVRPELASDLRYGVLIGLLSVLLLPFGAPFKAYAESRQRGYWINGLLLVQSLAITGAALLLAYYGWGIAGQFGAVVLGTLLFNLPLIWRGVRQYPGLVRSAFRDPPDPGTQRNLRKLNVPTFVFNFASQLSLQTDSIIVALLLGPSTVVPLFLTQKLIVMAQGQMQSVGNASWAAFAELHFQGRRELFNQRLIELTRVVAVFGSAVLTPIAVYNRYFIGLWVGPEHYGGDWVGIVSSMNALLLSLFSLWGWCFSGTGRLPLLLPAFLIQTVINVGLSLHLARTLGLIGPLLGTFLGFVAVSLWYLPKLLRQEFGTPLTQLFKAVVSPLMLAVPYSVALWWIASVYPPVGWFELGGQLATAVLAYLAFWWLAMLDRDQRARVAERASMMIGRKK
jgi:O-antigen/teichoic acid export membrane protein